MKKDQVFDALKSYILPEGWGSNLFLLPEDAMSDIYDFIIKHKLRNCIELGTAYGATSCVMAAAVDELGGGRVVTIDKIAHQPVNIKGLLKHAGLNEDLVEYVVDDLGYNWYMADLIRKQTHRDKCLPLFDFCLLDGAHEFETDALAFFLVSKLLKPNGWLVMDDLIYNIRMMLPNWREMPMFANYSERAIDAFQMKMLYELVVRQHPDFGSFHVSHANRLGWAKKHAGVQVQDTPVLANEVIIPGLKLDLGCGPNKKEGFIGIDELNYPCVDLKLELGKDPLPYPDDSVSHVFSSHFMEHLDCLEDTKFLLSEIVRVCKNRAIVEIWTPYAKSSEAFVVGHRTFFQEAAWKHICMFYADAWQNNFKGRIVLKKFQYVLYPGIEDTLKKMGIPLDFAMEHLVGIAWEFCAVMEVVKDVNESKKYVTLEPESYIAYSREAPFRGLASKGSLPAPAPISPADGTIVSGTAVTYSWKAGRLGWAKKLRAVQTFNRRMKYFINSRGFPTVFLKIVHFRAPVSKGSVPAPTLISPGNNAVVSGTSVSYSWNAVPGATAYSIYVSKSSGFSDVKFNQVVSNTFAIDSGYPDDGAAYYWMVFAWNGITWGPGSAVWNFYNGPQ